jgi:hypothetical protein
MGEDRKSAPDDQKSSFRPATEPSVPHSDYGSRDRFAPSGQGGGGHFSFYPRPHDWWLVAVLSTIVYNMKQFSAKQNSIY